MSLAHFGCPVFCSENGDKTPTTIKELTPTLVLLDSMPPDPQWVEIEKAACELKSQPTFLLLTDPGDRRPERLSGRDNGPYYMDKPFNPMELTEKVGQLLTKGQGISEVVAESREQRMGIPSQFEQPASSTILGVSKKLKDVLTIVDRVVMTDVTVLIRGESGTGKELIARRIHQHSARRDKPFIKVLCPAIPDTLLESELFGYEKGSFTGALTRKPGRFEFAHEGSIFLDEIGSIPFSLQSKLLQVLQEGEFARIGGKEDIRVNVRIISATNKDLEQAVREGSFREDLFYRLNVVNIYMPPLRDRKEDIPILVRFFLDRFNRRFNKRVELSDDTIKLFMEYHWPGNVRELQNMLEGMVIVGNEKEIIRQMQSKINSYRSFWGRGSQVNAFPEAVSQQQDSLVYSSHNRRRGDRRQAQSIVPSVTKNASHASSLKLASRQAARAAEQELIQKALDQTNWNRKEAAKILGISYKAILYKIKQLCK